MTKRKRLSICILTKLPAAALARLSGALPIALLSVFLAFPPFMQLQAAVRDSLYTFCFVPKRGMFYVPYKKNGEELERLLVLIRQHRQDILSGNIPVFVSGFCQSASADEENRRLARERSNRVKTEMILRGGLREECFRTTNSTGVTSTASSADAMGTADADMGISGETGDVVSVRIALPEEDVSSVSQIAGKELLRSVPDSSATGEENGSPKVPLDNPKGQLGDAKVALDNPEASSHNSQTTTSSATAFSTASVSDVTVSYGKWSVGLNLGVPFFWGNMLSLSGDKTYIGLSAGLQADYRFSSLLGISLSVDYVQGKAGAQGYANDYRLSPSGMTLYSAGTAVSRPYKELYSGISVVDVGLGLDIHLNRLFGTRAVDNRFQAVLTPAVYGQFFHADLYNKVNDEKFSDGTTKPRTLSLGLGGALSFRYRIASAWSLQLKNSVLWITDNKFDGIVTPYGHAKQNLMWLPQLGILWTPE